MFLVSVGTCAPAESVPPPPASPTPPVEEVGRTLSGAKRDFEVVKSLRDHGADPKTDSNRLVLPRGPSGPAAAASVAPRPEPSKDPKPGTNWLVDAMQKREAGKQTRSEERRDLESKGEDRPGREGDQASAGREQERNGRVLPPNPFAPYMQGWISPVDEPLLRPAWDFTRGLPGPGNENGANEGNARMFGSPEDVARRPGASLTSSKPPGGGATSQTRENPYLLNLENGAAGNSRPGVPARPSVGSAAAFAPSSVPAGGPPAAVPLPQSRIPEFVRPNADDKYFKPLKRF